MHFEIKHFNELTTDELYKIIQLRIAVFVVEQNCPYQDLDDKDQRSLHLLAWEDASLVGLTRLVPPKVSYDAYSSIGRVVTHPDYRAHGLGRKLMEISIQYCFDVFPGYNIKISAQSYLIPFYESLEFEKTGTEYLEDNIPHHAMIKHSIQFGQQ